jgi:hypothetical protein
VLGGTPAFPSALAQGTPPVALDAPEPVTPGSSSTTPAPPGKGSRRPLYTKRLVVADLAVGVLPRAQVPGPIAASVDAAAAAAAAASAAPAPAPRKEPRGARAKERPLYQPKVNYVRDGAPLSFGPVAAGVEAPVPVGVHLQDAEMQALFEGSSHVAPTEMPVDSAVSGAAPAGPMTPGPVEGAAAAVADLGADPGTGEGEATPAAPAHRHPGKAANTPRITLSDGVPDHAAAALVAKGEAVVAFSGPYALPAWKHPLYLANAPHWGDHDILPGPQVPGHPRGEEWLFEEVPGREDLQEHQQQLEGAEGTAAQPEGKPRTLDRGPEPRPCPWAQEGGQPLPSGVHKPLAAPYCTHLHLRVPPRLPSLPVRVAHLLMLQGPRAPVPPVLPANGKPPFPQAKGAPASALFAERARPDRTGIGKNQGGISWPGPMSTLHTVLHRPHTDVRVVQWGPPPVQSVWLGK